MVRAHQSTSRGPALIQALEPRLLLSGGVLISELMAVNSSTLADGDGFYSDWIELYNVTDAPVTMDGWYLTDDDGDLTKWAFPDPTPDPDTVIQPGEYLVVFASNGREDVSGPHDPDVDPAGNWHTNFKLGGSNGEYLALVEDQDGQPTVVHAYDPKFPEQLPDISYGLPDTTIVQEQLVTAGASVAYHVPTAADADLVPEPDVDAGWTDRFFDDSAWTDTIEVDASGLLITEVGTGDARFVEIQNLATGGIDTTGWQVLVNNAASGINGVHGEAWALPGGSVVAGTILYGTDDAEDAGADFHWSGPIAWAVEDPGWAMIIDDGGVVMDFAAWGYDAGQIASLDVSYGGFTNITVAGQWTGQGADAGTLSPGTGGFVAFNDHVAGTGTHANTTVYAANGDSSGLLKDIATGTDTAATLTTTHRDVHFATNGAAPATGTDAHQIFDGFVDFRAAGGSSLEVAGSDHYTHTFTGLDTGPAVTYTFAGTAIRGSSSYSGRWTLVTLDGAENFTDAHSTGIGVVTHDPEAPDPPVAANQVAIWSGYNSGASQGFVAAWTGIDPGADGVFTVISTQYTGPTPGVGSGTAGGDKGYGLAGIRLEEVAPLGPTAYLRRTGDRDGDKAGDFVRSDEGSTGQQNPDMTAPFGTVLPALTGVGFSDGQAEFDQIIATDVGAESRGVNASLWTRIEFQVDNALLFDTLTLRMKYDDGFVAYINGTEVASRNAPTPLAYDSAATAAHPDPQAVLFEDIDISDHLGAIDDGVNVLAVHALNVSAADGDLLVLPELTAVSELVGPQYMTTPTPRAANIPGAVDVVADTTFSVDRGFYTDPFDVEITCATPGAEIYYTLDGSWPSDTDGTRYTSAIHVAGQTVLRAAAYKPGWIPSNADTQTYIFLDDVVNQDYQASLDAGLPTSWGSTSPDYGMDPDVIGTFDESGNPNGDDNYGGIYAATIRDDLMSIPTVSIVMDADDMFGSNGIYTYSTRRGIAWERATSAELIHPDGSEGFQVNCGIRIQGGYFRSHGATRKHSLRLLFKEDYGPSKLEFPWFGDDAVDNFDTITLRAGANDGYAWTGAKYTEQYTRDEFGRRLQLAAGRPAPHGDFVHLYINGVYWGLYNPVERPDDAFSASYFGGDKDDWDAVHVSEVNAGTRDAWNQMLSQSAAAGGSNDEYMKLQGLNPDGTPNPAYPNLLDVEAYIDYLLVGVWGGNWDWPWKNWWAGRNRTDASTGFQFYTWDFENTIGNNLSRSPLNKNALNNDWTGNDNAGQAHTSLKPNAEYKLLFADRAHRLLYNGGVLTPEFLIPLYTEVAGTVERAVVAESARWGDSHFSTPLTLADWYDADTNYSDGRAGRGWILDYYLPNRTDIVKGQLKGKGLYPNLDAPVFHIDGSYQHGGDVAPGAQFTMPDADGTIYYTLDGADPRQFGGAIVGTEYTSGQVIPLSQATRVRARVYSGGTWSALNDTTFYVSPPAPGEVTVTELNYHPHDPTPDELAIDPTFTPGDFEFVEMLNTSDRTVELSDVKFTHGVDYAFTLDAPVTLAAGQYAVLVANPSAFEARYGTGVNVVGVFDGSLENAGERVALAHPLTETLEAFEYGDSGNWPNRADGSGSTLEIVDPAEDHTDPANWRSSSEYGGSPGYAGAGPLSDVVVNEVLTHTDAPQVDAIELHNTTGGDIDIGGWFLSDSNNDYAKFQIPALTTIPAGGYLVFYEGHYIGDVLHVDHATEFGGTGVKDFALSSAYGDDVWLLKADSAGKLTHFADHVEFQAAANGESFGRWPDTAGRPYPMAELTLGSANTGPRVGPVVIDEIHYHPEDPDGPGEIDADNLEFIEIWNPTTQTVNLWDSYQVEGDWTDYPWTVEGFSFAAGAEGESLAPGQRLVVVPFDPDMETDTLADFETHYGLVGSGVRIVGPYKGQLNDTGETVRLERPDQPPLDNVDFVPYLLVDEVTYGDQSPWPTEPGTDFLSLSRVSPGAWGNDPASWVALAPTPGTSHDAQAPTLDAWFSAAVHDGSELLLAIPDDGSFSEPRNAGITTLVLAFSEAVDFSAASVALAGTDGDGAMDLSGITAVVSNRAPDRGQILFSGALPNVARYLIRLDGVTDIVGNALAGDCDRVVTGLVGDVDGDLETGMFDLLHAWDYRGQASADGADQARSDVDRSAAVDGADLVLVWDCRGHHAADLGDPPPVAPAPGSQSLDLRGYPGPLDLLERSQGFASLGLSASPADQQSVGVQIRARGNQPLGLSRLAGDQRSSGAQVQAQGSQSLGLPDVIERRQGLGSPGVVAPTGTEPAAAVAVQLEPDLSSGLADPLTGRDS